MDQLSDTQRKIVIGVGSAVGVLILVVGALALLGGGSSDKNKVTTTGTSTTLDTTTTTIAIETTVTLPVVTSIAPSTAPPTTKAPAATTTAAATTTTIPGTVVNGTGALVGPATAETKDAGSECATLGRNPDQVTDCKAVDARGGSLVYVVEGNVADGFEVAVWKATATPGTSTKVLDSGTPNPGEFTKITVKSTADVNSDGSLDIVIGYRSSGTGGFLNLDVVEGSAAGPKVTLHTELAKGAAAASKGQIDGWSANPGPAECCPSSFSHQLFRFVAGQWRMTNLGNVAPDTVPPSQF